MLVLLRWEQGAGRINCMRQLVKVSGVALSGAELAAAVVKNVAQGLRRLVMKGMIAWSCGLRLVTVDNCRMWLSRAWHVAGLGKPYSWL